jgi:hypothetical protein
MHVYCLSEARPAARPGAELDRAPEAPG